MKNIAFTLIGGSSWAGGYNYQINLFKALLEYKKDQIQPWLFVGNDTDEIILNRFKQLDGLKIIHSNVFNSSNKNIRLFISIAWGKDQAALNVFFKHKIDIVFEAANFYGWRFPIQTIAWIPDLQHKHLKYLFNSFSYWKREIGFQLQIRNGRLIMLSSEDAQKDFEYFYPKSKGHTYVMRFAVPAVIPELDISQIVNQYKLPQHFFYFPSQFWEHKNHECVIRALSIAKNQGVEIVIATSGKQHDFRNPQYFPRIEALIASLELTNNLLLLGEIPYQYVLALMWASDAVINSSKFEGWSTTVEEAKSLGIKLLLSDLPVHREQASGYAEFFNPDSPDELAKLLCHFKPLTIEEKTTFYKQAQLQVQTRFSDFAEAFTKLVELESKNKK